METSQHTHSHKKPHSLRQYKQKMNRPQILIFEVEIFIHTPTAVSPILLYMQIPTFTPSPLHKHILHRAPVLGRNQALDLSLGKPLEGLVAKHALAHVRLAGHDARLHEEDLFAKLLLLVGVAQSGFAGVLGLVVREFADGGLGVVEVVVGDRVVTDDPGVHVEAGGLHDDALGGLGVLLVRGSISSRALEE